jgi:hypothetical protein
LVVGCMFSGRYWCCPAHYREALLDTGSCTSSVGPDPC